MEVTTKRNREVTITRDTKMPIKRLKEQEKSKSTMILKA